jgi:hypothetical protein
LGGGGVVVDESGCSTELGLEVKVDVDVEVASRLMVEKEGWRRACRPEERSLMQRRATCLWWGALLGHGTRTAGHSEPER